MKEYRLAVLLISATLIGVIPASASDWVDDDDVKGFYSRRVLRGDDGETYTVPDQNGRRAPGRPVNQIPDDDMNAGGPDDVDGGMVPGFPRANGNNMMLPNSGQMINPQQMPPNAVPPAKKGFIGKAKSFGKSLVKIPQDTFMGTEEMLSSPGFWQGAGSLAGLGAGAYMNYKLMKNNPYYNGYSPYGPYYNSLNPLMPLSPYNNGFYSGAYNPYGYGGINPYTTLNPLANPYLGSNYGGINLGGINLGLRSLMNPFGGGYYNPYGSMYNPYGSPYNPYGSLYNPYGGGFNMGAINPGGSWFYNQNGLGGLTGGLGTGALGPISPSSLSPLMPGGTSAAPTYLAPSAR